jgi:hypothetical protein
VAGDVDLVAMVRVRRHEDLHDAIAGRLNKVDGRAGHPDAHRVPGLQQARPRGDVLLGHGALTAPLRHAPRRPPAADLPVVQRDTAPDGVHSGRSAGGRRGRSGAQGLADLDPAVEQRAPRRRRRARPRRPVPAGLQPLDQRPSPPASSPRAAAAALSSTASRTGAPARPASRRGRRRSCRPRRRPRSCSSARARHPRRRVEDSLRTAPPDTTQTVDGCRWWSARPGRRRRGRPARRRRAAPARRP